MHDIWLRDTVGFSRAVRRSGRNVEFLGEGEIFGKRLPQGVQGVSIELDLLLQGGERGMAGDGPSIPQACRPLNAGSTAGRDPDRRPRLLHRLQRHASVIELEMLAIMAHLLFSPQALSSVRASSKRDTREAPPPQKLCIPRRDTPTDTAHRRPSQMMSSVASCSPGRPDYTMAGAEYW